MQATPSGHSQNAKEEKVLKHAWRWFFIVAWALCSVAAYAETSALELEIGSNKQHVTADRTLYHSNEKVYEFFGHVVVAARGQRLTADYAWIDTATLDVRARGNVILVTPTSMVNAAELHYNFANQLGTIFYGRVTNDAYTLKGQLIRKVSQDRFLTTDGEYSTCRDCSESWKLAAKSIDLTFEGYAFMDSAFITIKNTPTLYVPYIVLPVKKRRQTGLLFPRVGSGGGNGFVFVQPLFVAIDSHQDMTLGYGTYSKRGRRAEFEYRYKSFDDVGGAINAYYIKDRTYENVRLNRFAVKTEHNWSLFKPMVFKWRVNEVSDHEYIRMLGDIGDPSEPVLESGLLGYMPFSDLFLAAEVKHYRNMLYNLPYQVDGGMVQATPSVYFGTKERTLGLFGFNLFGRFDNYNRINGSFDDANGNKFLDQATTGSPYPEKREYIRETQRFILTPTIAAPFRLGRGWSVSPSLEYNEIDYNFPLPQLNSSVQKTQRQYAVARLETSTVLDHVFDYDSDVIGKIKHQIIPKVTYTYIPWRREDASHPFIQQLDSPGGPFDQFDVVPLTNSTNFLRLPLGNALSYGFTSHLISKRKKEEEIVLPYPYDVRSLEPKKYGKPVNKQSESEIEREKLWDMYGPSYDLYNRFWDFSVDQAYDFKERAMAGRANDQEKREGAPAADKTRAFSRLLAVSNLSLSQFSNSTEYTYWPRQIQGLSVYKQVHSVSTSNAWTFKNISNSRGTLFFKRALSLGYTTINRPSPSKSITTSLFWSLNDYFSVEHNHSFNLMSGKDQSYMSRIIFSSPSECWQIALRHNWDYSKPGLIAIDFGINLFGSGYTGLGQAATQTSGAVGSPINMGPLGR